MSLLQRASKLLEANINHLLDTAEDPEVMLKQLIHDMDESVVELRREAVNAMARQKRLEKKASLAMIHATELEKKALLSMEKGNEKLARKILADRVDTLKVRARTIDELKSATSLANQIKNDLVRMQAHAEVARALDHRTNGTLRKGELDHLDLDTGGESSNARGQ